MGNVFVPKTSPYNVELSELPWSYMVLVFLTGHMRKNAYIL